MSQKRTGTRCAVCTYCGRCFEEQAQPAWTGERCEVCVSCGKCAQAWGLIPSGEADAESGPTNWADAFKVMDTGGGPAPPAMPAPAGSVAAASHDDTAGSTTFDASQDVDAVTGATPGVASACKDLGLDDITTVAAAYGVKPPGQR